MERRMAGLTFQDDHSENKRSTFFAGSGSIYLSRGGSIQVSGIA